MLQIKIINYQTKSNRNINYQAKKVNMFVIDYETEMPLMEEKTLSFEIGPVIPVCG